MRTKPALSATVNTLSDAVPLESRSPQDGRSAVVELRGIKKSYGAKQVLHGVDLTVHAGEHVVIFGPSGSGKSTLLRTINLLEEPSEGSVRVLGVEYGPGLGANEKRGGPLQLRRHVGMVFQQFNLFPHLTALDNIARPLRSAKGLGRAEAEKAAAGALSLDPKVMLFDEPTSALDPELVGEVLGVMRQLAESGMTMVIVTHELNFAREIGDFNVFMDEGLVVESGPRGFLDTCTNQRTKRFLAAVL